MKYVIERIDGQTRSWWTGHMWSDIDIDALWYANREDAEKECILVGGTVVAYQV